MTVGSLNSCEFCSWPRLTHQMSDVLNKVGYCMRLCSVPLIFRLYSSRFTLPTSVGKHNAITRTLERRGVGYLPVAVM